MSFHDVRFPDAISYGSSGGPQFNTTVLTLASGFEKRNVNWSKLRAAYDVAHGIKDAKDMDDLRAFFIARMGMAYSFRFKDWADYIIKAQSLGTGDGVKKTFQMVKSYTSGGFTYQRLITKLVSGTLQNVFVGGVQLVENTDFTVNYATGVLTFTNAPALDAAITIGYCEFDVHVRFDTDHMSATHDFWMTESWESIPLVEIKEDAFA